MEKSQHVRSKRYPHLFRPANSKVWWAYIPVESGRRLKESTRQQDERAAHFWYLERIKSDLRPSKPQISLHEALDARRSERESAGRAEGTIHCLGVKAKALEKLLGAETPLSAITAEAVDDYIATRLKGDKLLELAPVERTTVHKELSTLRGALKLARRNGYECPPYDEVMPLDFDIKYKPKERALSEHEIGLLIGALAEYPMRRAIVAFLLATGATYPSEVQGVRPGDIDQKKWIVHLRGTKRTTRDRRVPVVAFMRPLLALAVGYIPFDRWGNVRRDLHDACDRAGIAHCSPNDLRRSVATLLRAKGVEPTLIGAYLGHKDSRMVERVYGRLPPDQLGALLKERLG